VGGREKWRQGREYFTRISLLLMSEYGVQRKKKGYSLRMLIEELHFLELAVYDLIQKNWGTLDITVLGSELKGFQNGLHVTLLQLMEPFAEAKKNTV